jgi:hypothetical protein
MTNETPFDQAHDADELLDYLMWHQAGPQKRSVAIENLRSLDAFGLSQLRAEMRYKARQVQHAGMADTYDPWKMD